MSLLSRLLPLVLFFIFVGILGIVGLVVYSIVSEVKQQTKEKLQKNNVNWSRDGVTVELKGVADEEYKYKTQSVLVDIWNHGTIEGLKYRWRRSA